MTKYFDNNYNTEKREDIPLSIASNEFVKTEQEYRDWFCKLCNRKLYLVDRVKNEWTCTAWNVSAFPESEELRSTPKLLDE